MNIILGYRTVKVKKPIKISQEKLYEISEKYHQFLRDIKRSKENKERLERIALTARMLAEGKSRGEIMKELNIGKYTFDSYIDVLIDE